MTTRVQGAMFRYSHTIGRGEEAGPGFKNPVALALGEGDLMYVVSRAYDFRADSKRITICTVGEEYIGEIGNAGRLGEDLLDTGDSAAAGSLVWPVSIDLDSQGNLYVSDEWLNRISIFSSDGDWVGSWGTRGQADGEIDPGVDTVAAGLLFIGTIQGLVMQALLAGDTANMQNKVPGIFAIYRRGIENHS